MGPGRHEHHAHGGEEQEGIVLAQVLAVILQVLAGDEHRQGGPQDEDQVKEEGEVIQVDHAGEIGAGAAPEADGLVGRHRQARQGEFREEGPPPFGS